MKYYCSVCDYEVALHSHELRGMYYCGNCNNRYVKFNDECHRITFEKWETFLEYNLAKRSSS